MAYLAATNVVLSGHQYRLGRRRMWEGALNFGNGVLQYPAGGVPLPAIGAFGMNSSMDVEVVQPDGSGIIWKYNQASNSLKAYTEPPLVVFEEVVALTGNTAGVTRYPMAWPLYAYNGNQALNILPAGLTPITHTISVNMFSATPGVRAGITALAGDSLTTVTITYITQAWVEVFENLVENDQVVAGVASPGGIVWATGTPNTFTFPGTQNLLGVMVGLNKNGTISAPKPIQIGSAAAAGEFTCNLQAGPAVMSTLNSDAWGGANNTVIFNYLRQPAAGFLKSRFISEDAITSSSQVATLVASGALVKQPLLLATPGFIVSATTATAPLGGIGISLGSLVVWKPTNFYPNQKLTTAGTFTSGTGVGVSLVVKPSYLWGVPEDIEDFASLEMPDGKALRNKIIRVRVWGN